MNRPMGILCVALTFLVALCVGAKKEFDKRDVVYVRPCNNNIPDGFCIDLTRYNCPAGYKYTYSACGFLEKCCYPGESGATKPTTPASPGQTTQPPRPVSRNSCGQPSVTEDEKIVGGTQTTIEANPWQISMRYQGQHMCGGSLISDKWVLTAAHCIKELPNLYSTSQLKVLAGSSNSQNYYRSQLHSVAGVYTHTGYTSEDSYYDIALIKLSDTVDTTDTTTRKICLPNKGQKFDSEVCVATGWGDVVEDDKRTPTYLRRVTLPILSNQLCSYYMGYVHPSQICAGRSAGGKDTCQGDSGGPLVCKQSDGSWVQAGIVSGGIGCGRQYHFGYYTEVADFIDWIDAVMDKYGR